MILRRTVVLFIVLLTFPIPVLSQSDRATVTGRVTDQRGEPLPQAQIADPSLQRGTTTGPEGRYTLEGLPAGAHTLVFRFVGYQRVVREIIVEAGETVTLDVTLKEQVLETDGLTVTGTARAQPTLRTPQDIDVIGSENLNGTRSASLGAVLSDGVPGVSSVQTGSQAGKPVLRGLTGNRIRVLKDGIGQEYYQFGVRHFPTTSTSEAERIEVVRGPSSIQYGSDALGGAINVITRSVPTTDVGDAEIEGRTRLQYFANNNERAGSLELGGARGRVGGRVGLERRVADEYTAPDGPTFFQTGNGGTYGDPKYTGTIPFTNFDQWTGYAQIGTEGDFGRVQVYGDYWANRHNFLLPTGGPDGDTNNPPVGLGQHLEHATLMAKGNLISDGFVLRPRVSLQRSVRQSGAPGTTLFDIRQEGGLRSFEYPLDLQTDIYTGRLEVLHPALGAVSGTVGAEVQYQDADTRGPVELQPSAQTWNVGLFAFEELDLEPWTLNAGVRGDIRTIDVVPNERTTDPDDLTNRYAILTGALGGNVLLADGVALATNLSSGFRAPSVFELYADGVHGGVAAVQQGNPQLEAERSLSGDLSMRVRRDRITAELTGYVNTIRNYIFLENTGVDDPKEGLPIFATEQTNAVISGVETRIEGQLQSWLHLGGQAALLRGTGADLADDGSDGPLPLLPANSVSGFMHLTLDRAGPVRDLLVELNLKRAFSKDAAGRYEPFAQFDGHFGPPFGTASTRAYTTMDVSAEGELVLGIGTTPSVRVAVQNLFNTTYRDFLDTYKGYALSPGRDVRVSLSVPF